MSLCKCENQYNVTLNNENLCENYNKQHVCFSINQTHYFYLLLKLKPTIKLTVNIHNNRFWTQTFPNANGTMSQKKTRSAPSESKYDDEPTTYKTATSADEHKNTHKEPWNETVEEEEKNEPGLDDKESSRRTTDNHDDGNSIHLTGTSATTNTTATASSTTTSKSAKTMAKLAK